MVRHSSRLYALLIQASRASSGQVFNTLQDAAIKVRCLKMLEKVLSGEMSARAKQVTQAALSGSVGGDGEKELTVVEQQPVPYTLIFH
ncbi:hypothetical protein MJO28_005368 [Puccinia striiformis f. sp. tritici]|uniref:Uncharacterized protein n=1 Tax=Puccinia striiformis f. sp. tritici TaxID=168172 RepID=A0ACC0EKH8_9BASI|nr:hypothetical protein MJO28_005368 [Puccinia striiformis f. sp. tritici]KAI7960350.1 hypothetical protein MJO29_005418 [Puccinia striiformis f. sp. tritici]